MNSEATGSAWVPVLAEAALSRLVVQRHAVSIQRPGSDVDRAARAERLAVLCEREAHWLEVLGRWVWRQRDARPAVPPVLAWASFEAADCRREKAAFWREIAADWRRRVATRPVCAVIGCGCDGECEVPA
jgi:hypothetical protein